MAVEDTELNDSAVERAFIRIVRIQPKVAEAAKVIENTQPRSQYGVHERTSAVFKPTGHRHCGVLAAAATKWTFLNFKLGLVGGDPYYLTCRAESYMRGGWPPDTRLLRDKGGIVLDVNRNSTVASDPKVSKGIDLSRL